MLPQPTTSWVNQGWDQVGKEGKCPEDRDHYEDLRWRASSQQLSFPQEALRSPPPISPPPEISKHTRT